MTLYQYLVALADYAASCTAAVDSVRWRMEDRIRRKILDAYLDKMLSTSLIDKIATYSGQPEKNYRIQCHDDYRHNWPEACKKVKDTYKNFLEGEKIYHDNE